MTHVVTIKVLRYILPSIKKEKLRSKKAHIDTKGTAKKLVQKGDHKLTKCIEVRVYDKNYFHYISMVSEELKWVVKEK